MELNDGRRSYQLNNDETISDSAFADKYKPAIIFLAVTLTIALLLVLLYVVLKKEMCNCFGTKKDDEEEGLYESADEESFHGGGDAPIDEQFDNDELPPAVDEQPPPALMPEIIVTESSFQPEKKSKKSQLKSIFKRKNKNKQGNVRFSDADEDTSLMNSSSVALHDSSYGATLAPLVRTDSMESFMSSLSTTTTNAEEFTAEELSPSRIQVFIEYDPKKWVLFVGAKQSECLITTAKETMYWQVHITLLPFKKHRFKTKYKSSSTPVFNQTFEIENIAQQALTQLSIRFRVYGRSGRAGRKKLAGETEVELSHIMSMEDYIIKDWRVLKRKSVSRGKAESRV